MRYLLVVLATVIVIVAILTAVVVAGAVATSRSEFGWSAAYFSFEDGSHSLTLGSYQAQWCDMHKPCAEGVVEGGRMLEVRYWAQEGFE